MLRFAVIAALVASTYLMVDPAAAEQRSSWRMSCYCYRDVNRNGIFDMGDRPFGALPVAMKRPDGTSTSVRSNIDGFANFDVKLGDDKRSEVFEPGIYEVHVVPPSGWKSTSDKHHQTLEMLRLPDAPGGMFLAETCRPIGIAPILRTSGRFIAPENINRDSISVSMIDSTGKSYSLPFDTHGNFEFVGYPGEWTLQIADGAENELYKRDIELKNSAVAISTIDLSAQHPDPIRKDPIVVGFDDLTISDALFEIPYGYNGLNWLNWISTHNRFYSGAGYVNATVSSEYIAYNSSGSPALIWSDDAPFDFVGTNIGMAWPRGEEDQVIFRAWRGGEMVYEDRIRPKRTGGLFFAANYLGIDKLEIRSGNYERIALDDFIFRKDSHK